MEMANIKINKDIEEYQEGIFIGLSLKETLAGIAAIIASALLIFLLQKVLPMILATYIGLTPAVVIGFFAFYRPNGMSFKDMLTARKQLTQTGKLVAYSTDVPEIPADKAAAANDFTQEIKKYLIKVIAVIVLLIIVSIILKICLS